MQRLITCLLILHLAAVVVAPWSVAPASMLSSKCWHVFRPYLQACYLNHGYQFFAPEPGPSHLVRYELELPDGTLSEGIFPDREQHWPRLIYHRHFMLSEYLNRLAEEDDAHRLNIAAQAYANHLLADQQAQRVTLFLRRHYIPTPGQVVDGIPLDATVLYAERPLGTFAALPRPETR